MKHTITALVVLLGIFSNYAQTEINDYNIEEKLIVKNDRLIVMDFYATWCAPCRKMEPIIAELEREYPNVDFYKMDVDKNESDDYLEITSIPTYIFIKNEENLEQMEGAMSKQQMVALIEKHMGGSSYSSGSSYGSSSSNDYFDPEDHCGDYDEFSNSTYQEHKNSWRALNQIAWHAYLEHNDVTVLLQAIKMVERSIELEANYYNVDTHAALLYKTGNYTQALKQAKEAIRLAKNSGLAYTTTTELIDKIIDRM